MLKLTLQASKLHQKEENGNEKYKKTVKILPVTIKLIVRARQTLNV